MYNIQTYEFVLRGEYNIKVGANIMRKYQIIVPHERVISSSVSWLQHIVCAVAVDQRSKHQTSSHFDPKLAAICVILLKASSACATSDMSASSTNRCNVVKRIPSLPLRQILYTRPKWNDLVRRTKWPKLYASLAIHKTR